MRTLVQNTARTVMVFLVDATDHVTGKTGATLTVTLSKAGAAFGSISPTVTERGNGWYSIALTSGNTDTLGDLALHITATGADPIDLVAEVVAHDSKSTATPTVNAAKVGGAAVDPAISGKVSADIQAISMPAVITAAAIASNAITGSKISDGAITASKIAANAIGASQLAADALTEIEDAVWNATRAGHTTAGTMGEGVTVADIFNSIYVGLIDDIWDEGIAAHAAAGSTGAALSAATAPTAAAVADAVWDEARSGHVTAGSFGEGVVVSSLASGAITAASIAADAITAAAIAADAGAEIATAVWASVLEGSHTAGDLVRGMTSALVGKVTSFLTGTLVFKSLDGSKTRWTITTDSTGRLTNTPGDLT